jgi:uncharacterized protein YjbI with pentapeptide repeats
MATERKRKDDDSPSERIDVLARIFIALLVGVIIGAIISQVGLDALQNHIRSLVFVFLWLILVTAFAAFWVVQNKERLLRRLFGVSNTDLGELNKTGQSLLFNIIEKDYDQAKRDLSLLFRKTTAWYSWMNFRRWVVMAFQTIMVGLAGVLGTILLYNQNKLLTQQNQLLNQQNIRLDQQTYLQEAERRSSLIFLMGNILDEVNDELKEDVGVKGVRDISPQLIGRVIALSNSLRPYRYLGNDSLVGRELSPERGYLLLAIVSSEIDKSSLRRIYRAADFSFSDLKKAVLSGEFLAGINLTGADLEGVRLDEADLSDANLSDAEMSDAILTNAKLNGGRLRNTILRRANLVSANLSVANLSDADLQRANLSSAILTNVRLNRANLSFADLGYTVLSNAAFEQVVVDSTRVSEFTWLDSLSRMGSDTLRGTKFLISSYYIDSVQTNLGWQYLLLRKKEIGK